MSRVKTTKYVFGEQLLSLASEEKRFATPEVVALYRAERLTCKTLVDLCCGLGFQSFAFAQFCNHVIAVDIDSKKIAQAKKYAEKLRIKNITFLCGDALSSKILAQIPSADVVFCDPERLVAEEERSLATITPDMQKILLLYQKITQKIAIELPPHLSHINFDAEYEYLSVDGALNRLTLYFGSLKKAEKSVVLLPHGERIEQKSQSSIFTFSSTASSSDYSYVLEPNPTVALTGLFIEALSYSATIEKIKSSVENKKIVQILQGKKIFFLSKEKILNPFFVTYKILQQLPYSEDKKAKEALLIALQNLSAKKVILRYSLPPTHYWKERLFFEKQLTGEKTISLFVFDRELLCEKE